MDVQLGTCLQRGAVPRDDVLESLQGANLVVEMNLFVGRHVEVIQANHLVAVHAAAGSQLLHQWAFAELWRAGE